LSHQSITGAGRFVAGGALASRRLPVSASSRKIPGRKTSRKIEPASSTLIQIGQLRREAETRPGI
jgi:hypothetical protein